MNLALKKELQDVFSKGTIKLLKEYTNAAILINACCLARERYETLDDFKELQTTRKIPHDLRLYGGEMELILNKDNLINKYNSSAIQSIFKGFTINSVSYIDAMFEDAYEILLRYHEQNINEKEIARKLRNAWSNDNLINYVLEKTKLQDSTKADRRIKESFNRLLEFRILRHAIVHDNGMISLSNIRKIDNIWNKSNEDERLKSIKNSSFYKNKEVVIDEYHFFAFRKFLIETTIYFANIFESDKSV